MSQIKSISRRIQNSLGFNKNKKVLDKVSNEFKEFLVEHPNEKLPPQSLEELENVNKYTELIGFDYFESYPIVNYLQSEIEEVDENVFYSIRIFKQKEPIDSINRKYNKI